MFKYLCAILAVVGTTSTAADKSGEFAIKGAGLQSCSTFVQAYDTQSSDLPLYYGWADGFVTAMNQFRADTFDAAPWQTTNTLIGLMRELCAAQTSNQRVVDVFNALLRDFRPLALTEGSGVQALRVEDRTVVIYEAVVQRLETVLAQKGFETGEIDGQFDDTSANAVRAFQAEMSIPVTGVPDQKTLFALFVRNASQGGN